VLISGVLIHIAPSSLPVVYEKLARSTGRYLCVDEYYNPTPVEVPYRGERERLFKRDFAGEILDRFPEFSLAAYGFVYHRDPNFPTDDSTWFLLEKGR
jgi:pseudaminic acid biosynthesis-associated methylase